MITVPVEVPASSLPVLDLHLCSSLPPPSTRVAAVTHGDGAFKYPVWLAAGDNLSHPSPVEGVLHKPFLGVPLHPGVGHEPRTEHAVQQRHAFGAPLVDVQFHHRGDDSAAAANSASAAADTVVVAADTVATAAAAIAIAIVG